MLKSSCIYIAVLGAELTPLSRKKRIFRGALELFQVANQKVLFQSAPAWKGR